MRLPRACSTLLLLACATLPACSEREAPVRPAFVLTEADVGRAVAASRDLKALGTALIAANDPAGAAAGRGVTGGVGITQVLGDAALPVLQKHGFATAEQFESTMAHIQVALQRILLGMDGGTAGGARPFQLRAAIQERREQIGKIEADDNLTNADKKAARYELEQSIESLEDQLSELGDIRTAMEGQFGMLPDSNVQAVAKYQHELIALLSPPEQQPPPK